MSDDFWTIEDFGFTAVNENELEVAQKASAASSTASENGMRSDVHKKT